MKVLLTAFVIAFSAANMADGACKRGDAGRCITDVLEETVQCLPPVGYPYLNNCI